MSVLIKPAMYWVELQMKNRHSLYVQERAETIVGAGFIAMERMKRRGYNPDVFTRIALISRPPKGSRGRVFPFEELSDEIPYGLINCSDCNHIVPKSAICLYCGNVLDKRLLSLVKNNK